MQAAFTHAQIALMLLSAALAAPATAKLAAPTPQQAQAAAAKKAQAAAQAAKEKQELSASMDTVAARWRARAGENGWQTYGPTTVAAPAGFDASANQSSASGQPGGRLGSAAANAPIRSEKSGTAAPSADVKDPAKKGK